MFHRVLITTDGTAVVERVILYAEHMARVEPAELLVLHAYEPPARYAGVPGYAELEAQFGAVAQAIVDEAVATLRDDGFAALGLVRAGAPGEEIVDAAREHNVDLIVMGMRSGNNLQAILGSVSAYVLRHAPCPVLQIP